MKQCYKATQFLLALGFILSFHQASYAQVYTVINTADAGAGSLRDAITQVNAGAATTVNFNLGAGAPFTINLLSDLPAIAAPGGGTIVINGYSEPSAVQGTISGRTISVNINAANANIGLDVNRSHVEISGLAIYGAIHQGIKVEAGFSNVFIWGNYIGTDNTGLTPSIGNANAGIQVSDFAAGAATTAITIGTNGDGTNDANEGNLVVSNGAGGITDGGIITFNTSSSQYSGNVIGLGNDLATLTNLFNNGTGLGIFDRSTGNTIGTNADGVSDALERNFISNNANSGIWVFSKSNNNVISNNVIGLTGTSADAHNNGYGIFVDNSSGTLIGTNANGTGEANKPNFISFNNGGGIQVKAGNLGGGLDQNADNTIIAGNFIGVALDKSTAAGNRQDGITIVANSPFTASNLTIGSDGNGTNEAVKPNVIANNLFSGVSVADNSGTTLTTGIRISKNSIYGNGSQGITLVNGGSIGTTGITANQSGGFNANGPNNLLNFPVITSAFRDFSNNIVITGFARPGAILEFYLADKGATSPAPLAGLTKNFGQGKTFLFQAIQGGTLNGITDNGSNTAGSYTNSDEGTSSGSSPINSDFTFSYTVSPASVGITTAGNYTLTAVAIDAANTSGNANNTSAFGVNFDLNLLSLPVSLLNFSGHQKNSQVLLQWSTVKDLNAVSYDIEKSTTGSNFVKIGSVSAASSVTDTRNYSFTDASVTSNLNFYRLRQIDASKKSTYSKVITFRSDLNSGGIKVFPSLFRDNINISIQSAGDDQLTISLIDQAGRVIIKTPATVSAGINSFNLSNGMAALPAGIYIVNITGNHTSFNQKLVKQ